MLTIINSNNITLTYLNNLDSANVHEVINGEYTLNFIALIEPLKTEYLYDKNNLIVYDNDYFRVVNFEELHSEDNVLTVEVTAEHISYDLIKDTKTSFIYNDRAAIYVMNEALSNTNFTFLGSDVTTTASIDLQGTEEEPLNNKSILYQIAVTWGGELEYFQKDISLKQQLGQNRGVDFRFGKNIQNVKRIVNFAEDTISYDVEVVQGSELEELGYFELGDTIRVIDDALNIDIYTRIIEVEKDIITGINSKVVLGQPIKDLNNSFINLQSKINSVNTKVDTKTIELNEAIQIVANDVQAVADGQIVTYYQATQPTEPKLGDLWFNTSTNNITVDDDLGLVDNDDGTIISLLDSTRQLSRFNGLIWELIQDDGIISAIENAQSAQTTADGKIVSFYQDTMPTDAGEGDLWVDTNDGNKLYRYNGVNWVSARDGSLALVDNVIDEHGNLIASKLSGTLQTAVETITGSKNGGITYLEGVGIALHNQPVLTESTEAMLLTANGILISDSKNLDGSWRWRTAGTGKSLSADAMTTGTLTAININGVTITGSTITSDDANSEIKLDNGILSIKKKSSDQQFNMNYKTGLPNGITQTELEYYNEYKDGNPNKLPTNTISLNSQDSYMGLEFGNAPVSLGNDWVKLTMYGGTFDWAEKYPQEYERYLNDPDYTGDPPPPNAQGSKMIVQLANSYWTTFKSDLIGNSGYGSAFLVFDVGNEGYVDITGDLDVGGNLKVHGIKNCTIATDKFGDLDFSAYETAEIYLGDIGEDEVVDGECIINLDEKLLACVNTDIPYQVFLTKYGQGDIWVEQRNKTNFIVKGDNIKFGWEVKAKRKGYENIRFGKPNK